MPSHEESNFMTHKDARKQIDAYAREERAKREYNRAESRAKEIMKEARADHKRVMSGARNRKENAYESYKSAKAQADWSLEIAQHQHDTILKEAKEELDSAISRGKKVESKVVRKISGSKKRRSSIRKSNRIKKRNLTERIRDAVELNFRKTSYGKEAKLFHLKDIKAGDKDRDYALVLGGSYKKPRVKVIDGAGDKPVSKEEEKEIIMELLSLPVKYDPRQVMFDKYMKARSQSAKRDKMPKERTLTQSSLDKAMR